jgi:dihydroorotate dehydrogenase electron transfer subunit
MTVFSEDLTVTSHIQCAPSYYRIAFEAPHVAAETVPGQFFMLGVSAGTDPLLRRPMSIYRFVRDKAGTPTGFQLLYKVVGRGTELLSTVRAGDTVPVLGPLGHGFTIAEGATQHVIVTGGTGVAPMVALAEAMVRTGIKPAVFYGAKTRSELACQPDFEELGTELTVCTDDGSCGVKGLVTFALEKTLSTRSGKKKDSSSVAIYACGPHAMLTAVARLAERAGVPCQVSLEARMGCGLGACMACAVRAAETGADKDAHYIRVCLQGPVIDSRRILWEDEQ